MTNTNMKASESRIPRDVTNNHLERGSKPILRMGKGLLRTTSLESTVNFPNKRHRSVVHDVELVRNKSNSSINSVSSDTSIKSRSISEDADRSRKRTRKLNNEVKSSMLEFGRNISNNDMEDSQLIGMLPLDVWTVIISKLDIISRLQLSLTCKQMFIAVVRNPPVWYHLDYREFPQLKHSTISNTIAMSGGRVHSLYIDRATDSCLYDSLGGTTFLGATKPAARTQKKPDSISARQFCGIQRLWLKSATLSNSTFTKCISILSKNLVELNFSETKIFDDYAMTTVLINCRFLKALNVSRTSITGALKYSSIFPAVKDGKKKERGRIMMMQYLPFLLHLDISFTNTNDSIRQLFLRLPLLQYLNVRECEKLSFAAVAAVRSTSLKHLALGNPRTAMAQDGQAEFLQILKRSNGFISLDIVSGPWFDEDICKIIAQHSGETLEDFSIRGIHAFPEPNFIVILESINNLRSFRAENLYMSHSVLSILKRSKVQVVSLPYGKFDSNVVLELANGAAIGSIVELDVGHCPMVEGSALIQFARAKRAIVDQFHATKGGMYPPARSMRGSRSLLDSRLPPPAADGERPMERLDIVECRMFSTADTIFKLRELLPGCQVSHA